GVEARDRLAVGDHREERLQTLGGLHKLVEALAIGAHRRAKTSHDVGDVAELLKDRVVRNGTHARGIAAIGGGGGFALTLDGPRSRLEEQVRAEGAENRTVAVVREKPLLEAAEPEEEIEAEVLL